MWPLGTGASVHSTLVVEYDDGLICCSDSGLVIRRYDMFLRPRRIAYARIRSVTQVTMGRSRRWRIWGSGDLVHWFNFDSKRPNKQVGLVLDMGTRTKPVITPDDPERVVATLRSHGVTVTGGGSL
jgi:hypothetical protein